MRSEEEIRAKLQKLQKKFLAKMVEHSKRKLIENCSYNIHSEIANPSEELPRLCFCKDNIERKCDITKVSSCPYFQTKYTKDAIFKKFTDIMEDNSLLSQNYRDIFMLKWVIDTPEPTWWDKVKYKLYLYLYTIFK